MAAHWYAVNYREAYGLFIANGILFNHESARRGETFVTRKITRALGRIKMGLQDKLFLGNLDARRDWGYAGDYVEAMWRMLQQSEPDDFVIATGESHSVREFLDCSRGCVAAWTGNAMSRPITRYFRPTEVDYLQGDASKARDEARLEAARELPGTGAQMVEHDLELARQEQPRWPAQGIRPRCGRDSHE